MMKSIYEQAMFVDPDGLLALSPKQTSKFKTWRRGGDLFHYNTADTASRVLPIAYNITGYEVM